MRPVPGAPAQEPGLVQRRSPGMMLEDAGEAVRAHGEQMRRAGPRRGKLDGLAPGSSRVAYSVSSAEKLLNIGTYLGVVEESQEVEIHAFGVAKDYRMSAKWQPLFEGPDGKPAFSNEDGSTGQRLIEKIPLKSIIRPVSLLPKRSPEPQG